MLYLIEDLSQNIKPLMRDNNKSLFILNQICSQKLFMKVFIYFCYTPTLCKRKLKYSLSYSLFDFNRL